MDSPKISPPPPLSPPPPSTPTAPPDQIIISKQPIDHQNTKIVVKNPINDVPLLRKPRRTNPIIWCFAVFCLFSILILIISGIVTIIIFVSYKPKTPVFDTPGATLNFIYLNSLEFLNGDIVLLANFSNPNKKLHVKFEYVEIQLYFSNTLIATRTVSPFVQKQREIKMVPIQMISSLVSLPPRIAIELQKQIQKNRVILDMKGRFKVRIKMGLTHVGYWLHGSCQLELTSPPNGFLLHHKCTTKK
ncbi:hypothetical protein Leryth_010154 [Lithospermum erythrorhizon]|nr:hypothetical protein Leryth_010154 [Lithospermum erythrorhizon]